MSAIPAVIEIEIGPHILVRAVWYVFIGWWFTGIVMAINLIRAAFLNSPLRSAV